MLNIHKPNHKLLILAITSICGIGALLGLYGLAYTPELSHAETVSTYNTISTITYMQDMDGNICANSSENETKQLIDARDGKSYWVAKLKDGNCWMTQNLDFDLKRGYYLTLGDSDVATRWNPTKSTQIETLTSPFAYDSLNESFDPGDYYFAKPTEVDKCAPGSTFDLCLKHGWKKVTGETNSEDLHYHIGNYYTYNMATAGTGASLTNNATASGSICPKGWQLPKGSVYFNVLFTAYGKQNNMVFGEQDIRLKPLYFVTGGYVLNKEIQQVGYDAQYWSPYSYKESEALFLEFGQSIFLFTGGNTRAYGNMVRCVVRNELVNEDNITNPEVSVHVEPFVSLDLAPEIIAEKNEANPSTADLKVKVSSNQPYVVKLSSDDAVMRSSTTSATIPAKSGLLNTAENGWGIKKAEDTSYTALTNTLQTFYTASGAEVKIIPFTIGISTAPDLPSGEYSTSITVTATQN